MLVVVFGFIVYKPAGGPSLASLVKSGRDSYLRVVVRMSGLVHECMVSNSCLICRLL